MSNKAFGVNKMRELVAAVAGPKTEFDNRDSWLSRAARRAGISYRQARAVLYGEISDPDHKAVRKLKEAAGRHEAGQLANKFESLAGALNIRDADFHGADVAALLHAARALRGLDRAGTDDTG